MKNLLFTRFGLPCLALLSFTAALNCQQQKPESSQEPIAYLDGTPIQEEDLELGGKLIQLEQQAYQLRLEALEKVVAERLLAKEAAQRDISVEELLDEEVHQKISEPTEEEVEAFYNRQKSRIRRPLEEVENQVREFLKSSREQELRDKLVASLRRDSEVEILLEAPRIPVEIGDAPRRGPEDAPVTIVEFSDFQCPYCRRAQPVLQSVRERYGDQVQFVYKDLPLKEIHPQAQKAAEAAHCAGEQGKYWEYHGALFAKSRITEESLPQIASELELDPLRFQKCLDSGKYEEDVDGDLEQALALGANSTPTFYINGIEVRGAQPLEAFSKIIESELANEGGSTADR